MSQPFHLELTQKNEYLTFSSIHGLKEEVAMRRESSLPSLLDLLILATSSQWIPSPFSLRSLVPTWILIPTEHSEIQRKRRQEQYTKRQVEPHLHQSTWEPFPGPNSILKFNAFVLVVKQFNAFSCSSFVFSMTYCVTFDTFIMTEKERNSTFNQNYSNWHPWLLMLEKQKEFTMKKSQ